jgi:hypothetical protein
MEMVESDIKVVENKEIWDDFIDQSPYGLLPHKWDFLKITERHTRSDLKTYGIYKGSTLISVFPVFYKRIFGLRMAFSPPPNTGIPYLGFVMSDEFSSQHQSKKEEYVGLVANEIHKELLDRSVGYSVFHLVPSFLDIRPFIWNRYHADTVYIYVLDLKKPLEEIWNNFPDLLMGEIKEGELQELEIRSGGDISAFHELLVKMYKEKNLAKPAAVDMKYIQELLQCYPQNLKAHYMFDDTGEIVAAMLTQGYKGLFMEWMDCFSARPHANELLRWNLIKGAKSNGYERYEILGANNKGTIYSQSKFNPTHELSHIVYRKNPLEKAMERFIFA